MNLTVLRGGLVTRQLGPIPFLESLEGLPARSGDSAMGKCWLSGGVAHLQHDMTQHDTFSEGPDPK